MRKFSNTTYLNVYITSRMFFYGRFEIIDNI